MIINTFCNKLKQAESGESVDASELSEYLMSRLFWPYITGGKIRLDDLDYDAFELDELDRLMQYTNDLEGFANTVSRVTDSLYKSAPLARTAKSFC